MAMSNKMKDIEDFNPALMREIREHEKHITEQLGQTGVTSDDDEGVIIRTPPVELSGDSNA